MLVYSNRAPGAVTPRGPQERLTVRALSVSIPSPISEVQKSVTTFLDLIH